MKHEKLPKSHGSLLSLMEFYQFCMFFATTKKLSIDVESLHFSAFSAKENTTNAKLIREMVMENYEMVMEK